VLALARATADYQKEQGQPVIRDVLRARVGVRGVSAA
jgi:hypothetical protein